MRPSVAIREAEKHGAAVAHENFRGLEIPAQEAGRAAEDRCGQSGYQCLAVQVGEHREENGGHRGDAGAQAVHMIEDAERSGDADNPEHRQRGVEQVADVTPQEDFENLRVNAGGQENARRERHSDEEFDLVMQPSAIVQETHGRD